MLSNAIILVAVALVSGYLGAQWQKKRQSGITKREATELRRDINEIKLMFGEHWDTHKIIKHHIETLNTSVGALGHVVGMEHQSRSIH